MELRRWAIGVSAEFRSMLLALWDNPRLNCAQLRRVTYKLSVGPDASPPVRKHDIGSTCSTKCAGLAVMNELVIPFHTANDSSASKADDEHELL